MFFGAARRDRVGTAVSLRQLRDRRSSLPGITRRITWLRLLSSHVSGYRGGAHRHTEAATNERRATGRGGRHGRFIRLHAFPAHPRDREG